jgi:hypothetical protein
MGAAVLSAPTAKGSTTAINTAASAHSTGSFTRTVNMPDATTAKIIFDQENTVSNESEIQLGGEVSDGATGVLHGTVTVLDPDGDNSKEITISASVAITNDETLVCNRPSDQYVHGLGVGG